MIGALLLLLLAADEAGPVVVVPPGGAGSGSGWIGAAVAETLPRALQRAGVPAVPNADRERTQESLGVPLEATATRATGIRVAEALGAARLVVGSWDLRGSELALSLRLIDARRGALSAPLEARGALSGLGRLVHALAWDVALAGPRPPRGAREILVRQADAVPFEALQALGEGLAARGTAARVAGLRRALALHPSYDEAALALGRVLVDAGRFEEAREVLGRPASSSSFARDARFLDGVALLGLGRSREADVLFAALAAERSTAAALGNRAVARLRSGPASGASALLRQAVEAAPSSVDLPFNLGWALLVEGEKEAAAFWLRGAVRRDPGDAEGRLLLSWALLEGGRSEEAEEQWRAAAALTPSLEPLRRPDLSRRFERVMPGELALVLDPARAADAEASRAHAARGASLLAASDPDGAASELARAALLDPYAAGPHLQLGRLHRGRGEGEKALAELQMALWCRDDPVLRREIAEMLRAMGRPAEARRVEGP